ncbi:hypothetical protein J6590_061396 [Homalodisca vitripennis]|nr:hypothetical protein J6590_061396 [Homalodisca vitripennis]
MNPCIATPQNASNKHEKSKAQTHDQNIVPEVAVFAPTDHRLPISLFQMTRRDTTGNAGIDFLVSVPLSRVLVSRVFVVLTSMCSDNAWIKKIKEGKASTTRRVRCRSAGRVSAAKVGPIQRRRAVILQVKVKHGEVVTVRHAISIAVLEVVREQITRGNANQASSLVY